MTKNPKKFGTFGGQKRKFHGINDSSAYSNRVDWIIFFTSPYIKGNNCNNYVLKLIALL